MKKSKLIKENMELYSRLDASEKKIRDLEKDLKDLKAQLEDEKAENEKLRSASIAVNNGLPEAAQTPDVSEPEVDEKLPEATEKLPEASTEPAEKRDVPEVDLDDDMQYAADIIAELVIESAKYSNRLTEGGDTQYIELVNLVLGKTEVSKAEILAITRENIPLVVKKQKIDAVKASTFEYFESVEAQKS